MTAKILLRLSPKKSIELTTEKAFELMLELQDIFGDDRPPQVVHVPVFPVMAPSNPWMPEVTCHTTGASQN